MNVLATQLATLDVHEDGREVLDRIAKRFSHVDDNGCVFITGSKDSNDRPRIGWLSERHRVARVIVALRDDKCIWQSWKWLATHDCDNKRCVNPDHLRCGDHASNTQEAFERGLMPVGERHGNAKLTEDQARSILHADGTQQQIADRFDVHRTVVGKIKRGEVWRHLHDSSTQTAVT